jgi:hypothetical protein
VTMTQTIPRSKSRKVNGYVTAVLALEAVRRKREERYDRYVRPVDRRRDLLAAEVAARRQALSGEQHAEAQWILDAIPTINAIRDGGSVRYAIRRRTPPTRTPTPRRRAQGPSPGGQGPSRRCRGWRRRASLRARAVAPAASPLASPGVPESRAATMSDQATGTAKNLRLTRPHGRRARAGSDASVTGPRSVRLRVHGGRRAKLVTCPAAARSPSRQAP